MSRRMSAPKNLRSPQGFSAVSCNHPHSHPAADGSKRRWEAGTTTAHLVAGAGLSNEGRGPLPPTAVPLPIVAPPHQEIPVPAATLPTCRCTHGSAALQPRLTKWSRGPLKGAADRSEQASRMTARAPDHDQSWEVWHSSTSYHSGPGACQLRTAGCAWHTCRQGNLI